MQRISAQSIVLGFLELVGLFECFSFSTIDKIELVNCSRKLGRTENELSTVRVNLSLHWFIIFFFLTHCNVDSLLLSMSLEILSACKAIF